MTHLPFAQGVDCCNHHPDIAAREQVEVAASTWPPPATIHPGVVSEGLLMPEIIGPSSRPPPLPATASDRPVIAPERREKVDRAREAWIKKLIDLSRRNNLLFYRVPQNRDAGPVHRSP